MKVSEDELGLHIWHKDGLVFFGGNNSDSQTLQSRYKNLRFCRLEQVHGTRIIEGGTLDKADGHWTQKMNLALCIQTADCLPIMIFHPHKIMALHAGWRGIEGEIAPKALLQLKNEFGSLSEVDVFVGPHIGKASFEVGVDVALRLQAAYAKLGVTKLWPSIEASHSHPEKAFIDLSLLAKAQFMEAGLSSEQIHFFSQDTFISSKHHSYRRDGARAGRQVSFIARLKLE